MTPTVQQWLKQLSLEEKAKFCTGQDLWSTVASKEHNIPPLFVADGPHGLRKMDPLMALGESVPATCFPTACNLSATWNLELIQEVGRAIGKECQKHEVQVLLGPGNNIKRSPLGGRNFEYFSEDPYLSGNIASAFIKGVQGEGVGTSLKHFVANNQEFERMIGSSILDERTLHEIYLPAFEIPIKEAQPWTVMCAYNGVNGTWASESEYLLTDILKDYWGFEGFVVSDWGAVYHPAKAVAAGLHLEMPANPASAAKIVQAVQNGELEEAQLDKIVGELLTIVEKAHNSRKPSIEVDYKSHHQLAQQVAEESIVLLKNEDYFLPIAPEQYASIAVIGNFAKEPRIQGSGSSRVNPTEVDNVWDQLSAQLGGKVDLKFHQGYSTEDEVDGDLLQEAVVLANECDLTLLFVGLPDSFEMEGIDRKHMDLPESHKALIQCIAQFQKNMVVVLTNGSAVEMHEWIEDVRSVVWAGLAGQGGGKAIADVLFGKVNPSGKLSESYPVRLEQVSSYLSFGGSNREVHYKEGVFVGYRYYSTTNIATQFPFGHGLSYTTFAYNNMRIAVPPESAAKLDPTEMKVICDITNVGNRAGKEVVQLYIHQKNPSCLRPYLELKRFEKVDLKPGETKTVSFKLHYRSFAYYDTEIHDWQVDSDQFSILIGSSCEDIRLEQTIQIQAAKNHLNRFDKYSTVAEVYAHPKGKEFAEQMSNGFGISLDRQEGHPDMFEILLSMPIAKRVNFSWGAYTEEMLDEFLKDLNN